MDIQPLRSITHSLQRELLETYEDFINQSRGRLEQQVPTAPILAINLLCQFTEDINQRLEYYKRICQFRKQLRRESEAAPKKDETFDFVLSIRTGGESK